MPQDHHESELHRELASLREQVQRLSVELTVAKRGDARYQLLFDNLNVGVFVTSLDGVMLECNELVAKMAGEPSREALLGRRMVSRYENPADRERMVQQLRDAGAVRNLEMWTVQSDGQRHCSSMTAVLAPIGPNGEQLILGMLEDVTARELAQKRVSQLAQSMERAAKLESLGVLAAGIAHDFNNLLSGLYGHLDLARENAAQTQQPAGRGHLDLAHQSLDKAKALTAQLLAFAKGGAPVRTIGSVTSCVKQCADFALSGSNVKLELDLDATLWSAEFDGNQLSQAFGNLIINAKQSMSAGGTLRIAGRNTELFQSAASVLKPGRYVKLSFADQGNGIAPSILERIFDPFFTTKAEGSGLGLTSAYAILQKHDGNIEVESQQGHGATFHVWLPAAVGKSEAPPPPSARATPRGQGLVLVMDDDETVRRVAGNMLARLGYEPILTNDGAHALASVRMLLAEGKVLTAALLDLTIRSGEGGRDTVGPLRELLPRLPIIASSGYSDDPIMANPKKFCFSASLRKPFLLSELSAILVEMIAEARR